MEGKIKIRNDVSVANLLTICSVLVSVRMMMHVIPMEM